VTMRKPKAKSVSPTRALARVGDPLVSERGEIIDPEGYENGKPLKSEPAKMTIDPATYQSSKKRTLKELPGDINVINACSVVFMYTILGVGDREIADALNADVSDVLQLRRHSAYGECFQAVLGEFINANSDLLSSRVAAYGQAALTTVGTLITTAKKEEVRLRASIDMLDRAGLRPKDVDQKQQVTKNELRIIVVDGDQKSVKVNLDMGDLDGDGGE
jgi:hypothetical protein